MSYPRRARVKAKDFPSRWAAPVTRARGAICQLFAKEIRDKEPNVRGSLSKTTHEIGIPLRPEGNINTHRIAVFHKPFLQVTSNTVQHLELNGVFGRPTFSACFLANSIRFSSWDAIAAT